jgi:tetratricopeptide (TPR) repeat protein
MPLSRHVELEGRNYTWNGAEWYESDTFLVPPESVVKALNSRLAKELEQDDLAIADVETLLETAKTARDALQYERAERLARRALAQSPGNVGALAILCSVLRVSGHPERALKETDRYRHTNYPPLLTSRAAAHCDLKQWAAAKKEVGQALAIQPSEEAFSVARRVKAARPHLYRRTERPDE